MAAMAAKQVRLERKYAMFDRQLSRPVPSTSCASKAGSDAASTPADEAGREDEPPESCKKHSPLDDSSSSEDDSRQSAASESPIATHAMAHAASQEDTVLTKDDAIPLASQALVGGANDDSTRAHETRSGECFYYV